MVLVLQGHIVAEWADVLENECLELIRSGLPVVLDLTGVTFIGRLGLKALGRLVGIGVGVIGCSPLIADMLRQEGIDVGRNNGETKDGEVRGKRGGLADA